MSRRRVYIKPFNADGTYADWIEVTNDVTDIGTVSMKLDVSDYDIGIFTNSGTNLSLINDQGKYSDVGTDNTIFKYKRSDSLVKVTWDKSDAPWVVGNKPVGPFSVEIILYQGLLNDDSTVMQLRQQTIDFNILGFESILERAAGPAWGSSPPADNKCSTLLQALVAAANAGVTQPIFTIDNARIVPNNDVSFDDLAVFTNKTCKDIANDLLEASNSVLYMDGFTPVVSARAPTADVKCNFYGPIASGPENILDVVDIRSGINRMFNFVTWNDTTTPSDSKLSKDDTSIQLYGVRAKDITIDGIGTLATRQSVIDSIRNEFSRPKQECTLTTSFDYNVLGVGLLSRISIDYPLVPVQAEDIAMYDQAIYDKSEYPVNLSSFVVLPTDHYKVIGLDFDLGNEQTTLYLRRI